MANTKISELTSALTAAEVVTAANVLLLTSDVQGDATSKKMTFAELHKFSYGTQGTAAANDLTPSVLGMSSLITANTTPVREITDFDNGVAGQKLTLIVNDAYTKIMHNANIKLAAGRDRTLDNGDVIQFICDGSGVWHEIRTSREVVTEAYATIYVNNGVTAQEPAQNTATKVTGFTDNGESSNCTAAAASDKLTIVQSGVYHVAFQVSFSGDGSSTVQWNVRTGSPLADTHVQCVRKLGTGGDIGSASCAGILSLTAGHDVEVWVTSDDATPSIVPRDMQLSIHRIN